MDITCVEEEEVILETTVTASFSNRNQNVWTCKRCMFVNTASFDTCNFCHASKPTPDNDAELDEEVLTEKLSGEETAEMTSNFQTKISLPKVENTQNNAPISKQSSEKEQSHKLFRNHWKCPTCYLPNLLSSNNCANCYFDYSNFGSSESSNNTAPEDASATQNLRGKESSSRDVPTNWKCRRCNVPNFMTSYNCSNCGYINFNERDNPKIDSSANQLPNCQQTAENSSETSNDNRPTNNQTDLPKGNASTAEILDDKESNENYGSVNGSKNTIPIEKSSAPLPKTKLYWTCPGCKLDNLPSSENCSNCGTACCHGQVILNGIPLSDQQLKTVASIPVSNNPVSINHFTCPRCATINLVTSNFCVNCGTAFHYVITDEKPLYDQQSAEKESVINQPDSVYQWKCLKCGSISPNPSNHCVNCGTASHCTTAVKISPHDQQLTAKEKNQPSSLESSNQDNSNFQNEDQSTDLQAESTSNVQLNMGKQVTFIGDQPTHENAPLSTNPKDPLLNFPKQTSESIKKSRNRWVCAKCNLINNETSTSCESCQTLRYHTYIPTDESASNSYSERNVINQWECSKCNFKNFSNSKLCERCGDPRKKGSSSSKEETKSEQLPNIYPQCISNNRPTPNESNASASTSYHIREGKLENVSNSPSKPYRWKCLQCSFINEHTVKHCIKCGTAHPKGWKCSVCCLINHPISTICATCRTAKRNSSHATTGSRLRQGGERTVANSWACSKCTCINKSTSKECEACGNPKETTSLQVTSRKWDCPKCTFSNHPTTENCEACGENRYGINAEPNAESYWICQRCTLLNEPGTIICESCDTECLYGLTLEEDIVSQQRDGLLNVSSRSWKCPRCTLMNPPGTFNCESCDTEFYYGIFVGEDGSIQQNRRDPSMTTSHRWACTTCTLVNPPGSLNCEGCGAEYNFGIFVNEGSEENEATSVSTSPGSWQCPRCTLINQPMTSNCAGCGNSYHSTTLREERVSTATSDVIPTVVSPARCDESIVTSSKLLWKCPNCTLICRMTSKNCDRCGTPNYQCNIVYEETHEDSMLTSLKNRWKCPKCTCINLSTSKNCERCGTSSYYGITTPDMNTTTVRQTLEEPVLERVFPMQCWQCPKCNFINLASSTYCERCGTYFVPVRNEVDHNIGSNQETKDSSTDSYCGSTRLIQDTNDIRSTQSLEEATNSSPSYPALEFRWKCPKCFLENLPSLNNCQNCRTPCPNFINKNDSDTNSAQQPKGVEIVSAPRLVIEYRWKCPRCCMLHLPSTHNCTTCRTARPGIVNQKDKASSLTNSELYWKCTKCTWFCSPRTKSCEKCGTKLPVESEESEQLKEPQNSKPHAASKFRWKCPKCTTFNLPTYTNCKYCGSPHSNV